MIKVKFAIMVDGMDEPYTDEEEFEDDAADEDIEKAFVEWKNSGIIDGWWEKVPCEIKEGVE